MPDTLSRLTTIFHEVFDDDDITIGRATTAADIDGWDSLKNVVLVKTVERAFGLRMSSGEATGLKNVGELIDLIDLRKTK